MSGTDRRIRAALVIAVVVVAISTAIFVVVATDDDGTTSAGSTTSTAAPATTSSSATSTTTTAVSSTAVWPPAGTAPIDDPKVAATAFATEYLGMSAPVVGELQQGDSRSGEIEVRPRSDGPVTTILLRMLGSDTSWSVLGAATADIELT